MDNDKKIEYLYKAMEDNQNTIRFTDTKAGAVIVVVGIIITFITSIYDKVYQLILSSNADECIKISNIFHVVLIISVIIMLLLLVTSVILAFLSLMPINNPIKCIKIDVETEKQNLLYLSNRSANTSDYIDYIKKCNEDNLVKSLIIEIQKISYIRQIKIQKVKYSMIFLMSSLVLLSILSIVFILFDFFN